jgi:hypothetical protein
MYVCAWISLVFEITTKALEAERNTFQLSAVRISLK